MAKEPNKHILKLISDPNKLVNEAKNDLARFFRILLRENLIDTGKFGQKLDEWSDKRSRPSGPLGQTKGRPNDRGNLVKAIVKEKISFECFILGMEVLNPLSFSITIGTRWGPAPEKFIRFNHVLDQDRYLRETGERPRDHIELLYSETDIREILDAEDGNEIDTKTIYL